MNIVILGATSTIAKDFGRLLLKKENINFILVGRNEEKLLHLKSDLLARGANSVHPLTFNLDQISAYDQLEQAIKDKCTTIDVLLIAHGTLPDQVSIENQGQDVAATLVTNFVSHATLLAVFANNFEQQKKGTIIVISSVAGDRGRRSNYVYGSAKAGMQAYLEGYAAKMARIGVDVIDIRPGMTESAMTMNLKKGVLFSKSETVAKYMLRALETKRSVVYAPSFWHCIMIVIKLIPRSIMKKLNF